MLKKAREISNSFGSFNTRKHTVKFSTGLMDDHFLNWRDDVCFEI
jgi:iron complex outermembrane receptor protein